MFKQILTKTINSKKIKNKKIKAQKTTLEDNITVHWSSLLLIFRRKVYRVLILQKQQKTLTYIDLT